MIAFVFPGQGSQQVGMGKDLAENNEIAKEIYRRADSALGFSLTEVSYEGPEEELMKTENAQPAILAYSAAVTMILKDKGIVPEVVAGHSLGEFSALFAAGMLELEDALRIVRKRGELMSKADPEGKGGMAAVLGLDDDAVKEVCKKLSETGYVEPVNFNTPGQVVISGLKESIQAAIPKMEEAGAMKVVELSVSGAFHSRLMESAAEEFGAFLDGVTFNKPQCKVISNVTADFEDESNVKELLVRQMKSPVLWVDSVNMMISLGVDRVIEAGYGRVVSGMVKKISRDLKPLTWDKALEG